MDEKTQFIEATLDWAEERMEYLINQGMMAEALDLGREFHEWMRAPLGLTTTSTTFMTVEEVE